ncbi:uncharacterized protein [Eurosta solidaginis]|uniref:uncharacterized protein n=1 Tax=Eurosta solidaginis TaxID=178769 RepID=UPI003530FF31
MGGVTPASFWHAQQQQLYPAPYPLRRVESRAEIDMLEREASSQTRNLDVSAGDLLSRTHEELVLLLIQLRRQNSNRARAIEQCCSDIHEVQNRLLTAEGLTRAESIHQLLVENSKKLEQTVAGNARLEQELIVLRQKLQASRGARGSQGELINGGVSDTFASNTTSMLESELKRVQTLVGDMQRQ